MSRKHNVKKQGGVSQYPARLAARGESSATVRMPFISADGRKFDGLESMQRRNREYAEERAERSMERKAEKRRYQ